MIHTDANAALKTAGWLLLIAAFHISREWLRRRNGNGEQVPVLTSIRFLSLLRSLVGCF